MIGAVAAMLLVLPALNPTGEPTETIVVHDAYRTNDAGGSWAYCVDCYGQPNIYAAAPSRASSQITGLLRGDTVELTGESYGIWTVCWHTGEPLREAACNGVPAGNLHTVRVNGAKYEVWLR